MFTIQRVIHTIEGDNSKCFFFSELCPVLTYTFYPLSSTPQPSVGTRMRCSCYTVVFIFGLRFLAKNQLRLRIGIANSALVLLCNGTGMFFVCSCSDLLIRLRVLQSLMFYLSILGVQIIRGGKEK